MALDLSNDRDEFEALREDLDTLRSSLEAWLAERTSDAGIRATVSGRVKDTPSYLRKILKKHLKGEPYAKPLAEMTDKVGVRADVLALDDHETLVARVEGETAHFTVVRKQDKALELGTSTLGYLGVHFDVEPSNLPASLTGYGVCEIQVRTVLQGAWAQISHDLVYKMPELVPEGDQRALNRLTSLVELFDEEVDRIRMRLQTNPDYAIGRILHVLESESLVVSGGPFDFDAELSRVILGELTQGLSPDDMQTLEERIPQFANASLQKLRKIYERYRDDARFPLLHQPEALLIFQQLDESPNALRNRWEHRLPPDLLVRFAEIWGVTLG